MLRIALLVVALAAGGTAAWLTIHLRSEPAPAVTVVQPMPPSPMQDVLVAAADLEPGQPLLKDNMRWQAWPESAVSSIYVTKSARPNAPDVLANAFVRHRIVAGEPIRDDKLVRATGGYLSTLLPSGKRAVGVRISAETTAGGLILPNDRVDVLVTIPQQGRSEHVTRTILRNIPVLAIDQSTDDTSKNEKIKAKALALGKTATLELNQHQAEILVAGEASGVISLALRSTQDNGDTQDTGERPRQTALRMSRVIQVYKVGSIQVAEITAARERVEIPSSAPPAGSPWPQPQDTPVESAPLTATRRTSGIERP
jgi:pilus assembly protein CpaB